MKSKITLGILLVVIIFLGALAFFFGYHYKENTNEIESLRDKVQSYENQKLDDKNSDKMPTVELPESSNTVKEKIIIARIDENKIDRSVSSVKEQARIINVGQAQVSIGDRETLGNKSKQVFRYKDNNYTFGENGGPVIIDAIYGANNDGSSYYYAVLLEDGSVEYAIEESDLKFKKSEITNAVRIVSLKVTDSNGRIYSRLGIITNDGVTHIVEM